MGNQATEIDDDAGQRNGREEKMEAQGLGWRKGSLEEEEEVGEDGFVCAVAEELALAPKLLVG
jgi:hypothetical protein